MYQSCPRVTFLGPDPTRPAETLIRPDPTRDCRQKVWPDPTRPAARPFPNMYSLQLNNLYLLISSLLYIKYRRKSINPNVVFEDSYGFRYQEIISETLKNPKCWPDPTRPAKIRAKSWPDPTRPDPRVHPTRGQLRCTLPAHTWPSRTRVNTLHACDQLAHICTSSWSPRTRVIILHTSDHLAHMWSSCTHERTPPPPPHTHKHDARCCVFIPSLLFGNSNGPE